MQRLAAANGLVALVGSESYLVQVRPLRMKCLHLLMFDCFTTS